MNKETREDVVDLLTAASVQLGAGKTNVVYLSIDTAASLLASAGEADLCGKVLAAQKLAKDGKTEEAKMAILGLTAEVAGTGEPEPVPQTTPPTPTPAAPAATATVCGFCGTSQTGKYCDECGAAVAIATAIAAAKAQLEGEPTDVSRRSLRRFVAGFARRLDEVKGRAFLAELEKEFGESFIETLKQAIAA